MPHTPTPEAEAVWVAADDEVTPAEHARDAHAEHVENLRAAIGAEHLLTIAADQESIAFEVAVRDARERRGATDFHAFGPPPSRSMGGWPRGDAAEASAVASRCLARGCDADRAGLSYCSDHADRE